MKVFLLAAAKPIWLAFFSFIVVLSITLVIGSQQINFQKEKGREEQIRELHLVKDRFRDILYSDITAATSLAIFYKQYGVTKDFDSIASQIIGNNKYAEALQITVNGVIAKIYPLKGFENTIGLQTGDSMRLQESKRAFQKEGIYFAGPRKLRQGGIGILGKVPIRNNLDDHAVSVVLTRIETIQKALALGGDTSNRFSYWLIKKPEANDTSRYLLSKEPPANNKEAVFTDIPEGDWLLGSAPSPGYVFIKTPWATYILGGLLAILSGFLLYRISSQPLKLKKIVTEKTKKIVDQEKHYRTLIETSTDAIVLLDETGKVLYQTPSVERILGYTHMDMQQIDGLSLIHPDTREQDNKAFIEFMQKPGTELKTNHQLKHKQGHYIWIAGTYLNLLHDETIHAIVLTYSDITEHKKAEIKIRENEEKFRMSFMTSPDVFYIGTLDEGRIIDVNNSFYDLFGYTREEAIGKTSAELGLYVYPEERAKIVAGLKTSGNLKDLELTCRKKNGGLIIVTITANIWMLNNEQVIMAVIRDITERKRIEKELVESEVRFRQVLENSLSASYNRNLQTNTYDYLSPVFKKIAGYTQDEMNSLPLETVIGMMHPDDVGVVRDGITRAINEPGRSGNSLEYRFKHKTSGKYHWLQDEFVVMHDEQGQAISFIGSVSDITERKRIEAELIESKEQLALFVEHSPASLAMFDKEMRYIATSRRWMTAYNLGDQQIIGRSHYEIFPEIGQDWKDIHQRCVNGAIEKKEEDSFTRQNGITDWVRWEIRPWHRSDGEIGGIIMFTEVITERILARQKLLASEETRKHIMNSALDAIVGMDKKGSIIVWTPQAEKIFGWKAEEIMGLKMSDVIIPKQYRERHERGIKHYLQTGEGDVLNKTIEITALHQSGKEFPIELSVAAIRQGENDFFCAFIRDITDRKQAQEKIKQSEERHRALVENIGDAIMLINEKFENIYQSPSAERISGFTLEDGKGKKVFDFIHPRDMETSLGIFQKAFNEPGIPVQGNFRIRHKNGHILWIEGTVTNLFHNESVKAIIVNYRDVTERKKATELFKYQFENSPDIILIIDKNFSIESINRSRLNGIPPEKLIGKNSIDLLPEESRDNAKKMIRLCFETGKNQEIENTLRDNRWVRSRFVPMIVDGEIMHIMIIATDITERKLAEESLKQSEANYRQLFDNSPAPMWVIDEKTASIIRVNQACIRNYGYSEEEFLGMTIGDISPGAPGSAFKKDGIDMFFMGSQRHIKRSGELIDVVTSSIPITLNGEKNILMIAIDVTEKNLYEQKLTKAAIKAQEEERYEIGGELHDNVCQILAGSLMTLGLMKNALPKQSIETFDLTHKYINMATDEIRNLSHRLAPAFFDNQTLEEAFVGLLNSFNAENKYTISLHMGHQLKKYPVNRDLQLNLYRILQEQLRNIMKHAKATAIEVHVSIKKDNMLQMKITDNGVGFDAKNAKGGIGLANMNRRVQVFSGTFTIDSAVGKGTKVVAEIPLLGTN